MAQSKTQPQTRTARDTRHKKRRYHYERPLAEAAAFSVLIVLGVAVGLVILELSLPNTPVRHMWDLLIRNGQVSLTSPLLQDFASQVRSQDVLFFTSLSLFCGGLSLGRLAGRRSPRLRVLRVGAGVAASIMLLSLATQWAPLLALQHGHLQPDQAAPQVFLTVAVCFAGWIAVFLIGTVLGLMWRDARQGSQENGAPGPTKLPATSR